MKYILSILLLGSFTFLLVCSVEPLQPERTKEFQQMQSELAAGRLSRNQELQSQPLSLYNTSTPQNISSQNTLNSSNSQPLLDPIRVSWKERCCCCVLPVCLQCAGVLLWCCDQCPKK